MNVVDNDFDHEDRGRYRHPETVGGMPYKDLERRVLAALGANVRVEARIKDHVGIDRTVDLSPVIEGMILDDKIRRCESGTLTAYFAFDEMPARFWNKGDGTIEAEMMDDFVPPTKLRDTAAETTWGTTGDSGKRGKGEITLDPNRVQEAFAKLGRQKAVAKDLRIGFSTLVKKLGESPALQLAAARGRKAYQAANPKKSEKPKVKSTMTRAAARQTVITPEAFRSYASKGFGIEQVAAEYGISPSAVHNRFAKPENKAAWDEGQRVFKAAKHGVEPVEVNMSHSRRKLEFDRARIEELAASGSTVGAAALVLDVGKSTLVKYVAGHKPDKSVQEAWQRGLARRDPDAKRIRSARKPPTGTKAPTKIGLEVNETDLVPRPKSLVSKAAVLPAAAQINEPEPQAATAINSLDVVEHYGFNVGSAMQALWHADQSKDPIGQLRQAEFHIRREIDRRVRGAAV